MRKRKEKEKKMIMTKGMKKRAIVGYVFEHYLMAYFRILTIIKKNNSIISLPKKVGLKYQRV